MSNDLDELIARLTQRVIQRLGLSHTEAEAAVRELIDEERVVYQGAGSPYGDTVAGLIRWIEEWPKQPPTA